MTTTRGASGLARPTGSRDLASGGKRAARGGEAQDRHEAARGGEAEDRLRRPGGRGPPGGGSTEGRAGPTARRARWPPRGGRGATCARRVGEEAFASARFSSPLIPLSFPSRSLLLSFFSGSLVFQIQVRFKSVDPVVCSRTTDPVYVRRYRPARCAPVYETIFVDGCPRHCAKVLQYDVPCDRGKTTCVRACREEG